MLAHNERGERGTAVGVFIVRDRIQVNPDVTGIVGEKVAICDQTSIDGGAHDPGIDTVRNGPCTREPPFMPSGVRRPVA